MFTILEVGNEFFRVGGWVKSDKVGAIARGPWCRVGWFKDAITIFRVFKDTFVDIDVILWRLISIGHFWSPYFGGNLNG